MFTSTAAAFAQAEGLLELDDTVVSHFGEFAADVTDPRSRSVKIRHVAAMASGHNREMLGEALARDPAEPVCVILPEHETVVVTTAYTVEMQAVLDTMWAHLLPGLGTATPGAGPAHGQLSERLGRLALPACPAAPAPADGAAWTGEPFIISPGGDGGPVHPTLTSASVMPEAGGWLDGRTLRAEVIFLETPHRMDITCSRPALTATAVWRQPPLSTNRLRDLHCPVEPAHGPTARG